MILTLCIVSAVVLFVYGYRLGYYTRMCEEPQSGQPSKPRPEPAKAPEFLKAGDMDRETHDCRRRMWYRVQNTLRRMS